MEAYPPYWLEIVGQAMKMNIREHELSMIATNLTLKVYESLAEYNLTDLEAAEVLLDMTERLVKTSRKIVRPVDDGNSE